MSKFQTFETVGKYLLYSRTKPKLYEKKINKKILKNMSWI